MFFPPRGLTQKEVAWKECRWQIWKVIRKLGSYSPHCLKVHQLPPRKVRSDKNSQGRRAGDPEFSVTVIVGSDCLVKCHGNVTGVFEHQVNWPLFMTYKDIVYREQQKWVKLLHKRVCLGWAWWYTSIIPTLGGRSG